MPTSPVHASTTTVAVSDTHESDYAAFRFNVELHGLEVAPLTSEAQLVDVLTAAKFHLTFLPPSALGLGAFRYWPGSTGFEAVGPDVTLIERVGAEDIAAMETVIDNVDGYSAHPTTSAGGFDCLLSHIPGAAGLECSSADTTVHMWIPDSTHAEADLLVMRDSMLRRSVRIGG